MDHEPNGEQAVISSQKKLKNRIKRMNKVIDKMALISMSEQLFNKDNSVCQVLKESVNGGSISIDDYFCSPKVMELDIRLAVNPELSRGLKFSDTVQMIMEKSDVPEMKWLLHHAYCKSQNCSYCKKNNCSTEQDSMYIISNPMFGYCKSLLEEYWKLQSTDKHLENLISEEKFREDFELFLSEIADDQKSERLRHSLRRINPMLLARYPYERRCECGADCIQEPIHSINNFLFVGLGNIAPIYASNPKAQNFFEGKKICRLGRFRDPSNFKDHYFEREICISEKYSCICGQNYLSNGVHSLCTWMLKHELVRKVDFINFLKQLKSRASSCNNGLLIRAKDMLTFIETNTNIFKECNEEELTDDKLYVTYCCRVRWDLQAAVICRNKSKVLNGTFLYLGMDYRRHFQYTGNLDAAAKILRNS